MAKPEQDESQRFNEPQLLEAEGFLNRAWRRLGEGLAPYVADMTGDDSLRETRDVYAILSKMVAPGSWDAYFRELGHSGRGLVNQLRDFRNGPWAHLVGYSDNDVLHYLGVIGRLLRAVSAGEQAEAVEQMWDELGKLIFSDTQPERSREIENAELRQRNSELERENSELLNRNSQMRGQVQGFRYMASLMMPFASPSPIPPAPPIGPDTGSIAASDTQPIVPDNPEEFMEEDKKTD